MTYLLGWGQAIERKPLHRFDILPCQRWGRLAQGGRVVEDQMPIPLALERFDMAQPQIVGFEAGLTAQDPLGGVLRVLGVM